MSTDTPSKYDQAYFLNLARPTADTYEAREEARARWNGWRQFLWNAGRRVTFENVDFTTAENRILSFVGFYFGDDANFSGAVFGDNANFSGANFGSRAKFVGATFGDWADFSDATFGDWANFSGSIFGEGASFPRTKFGDSANFFGATFGSWLNFSEASLGCWADFSGRTGEGDVAFHERAWRTLGEVERPSKATMCEVRQETTGFSKAKFSIVNFTSTRFRGSVSFARRSFDRPANFIGVRFDAPPEFDGAANLQRIDFTGARVCFADQRSQRWKLDWTRNSEVAVRLRALRSQIEATKNHDFERDLFIEERKAERGIFWSQHWKAGDWGAFAAHSLWIGVMGAYWALSNYGRSWLRPSGWLAASVPFYGRLYHALLTDRRELAIVYTKKQVETAYGTPAKPRADSVPLAEAVSVAGVEAAHDHGATVWQLALSNSVPFVGPLTIDGEAKKFLLCGTWAETTKTEVGVPCRPVPPFWYQAAMISQNVLSIILVFFIGLALRNYFRLK